MANNQNTGGTQGGSTEQHKKAGEQSHKNTGSKSGSGSSSGSSSDKR